jgi:hypothetical protein
MRWLGRLLGRAWGGHGPSRFIVVAGLLFGGWLLFADHGGASRPVVQNPPQNFRVHEARPAPRVTAATPPVDTGWLYRPEPAPQPVYVPPVQPPAPVYSAPVYSYPAGVGYGGQANYYTRFFPHAMAPHYAFAGHGFGFGHAFGGFGHFGHGGHR